MQNHILSLSPIHGPGILCQNSQTYSNLASLISAHLTCRWITPAFMRKRVKLIYVLQVGFFRMEKTFTITSIQFSRVVHPQGLLWLSPTLFSEIKKCILGVKMTDCKECMLLHHYNSLIIVAVLSWDRFKGCSKLAPLSMLHLMWPTEMEWYIELPCVKWSSF
jgi:hypothetical protein